MTHSDLPQGVISSVFRSHEYNWHWFGLLLAMVLPTTALAVGLQLTYQKRSHTILKGVNEFAARSQLGFFSYYVAVLPAAVGHDVLRLAVPGLLVLSVLAAILSAKFASQPVQEEILKTHACPSSSACVSPVSWALRWRLWRWNITIFVLSFFAAALVPLWSPPGMPSAPASPSVSRVWPTRSVSITPASLSTRPEWLSADVYWLEQEGDRHRDSRMLKTYAVGMAEYVAAEPNVPVTLVMRVPDTFALVSRTALRWIGGRQPPLLEQLSIEGRTDRRELRIQVPELDEKDRLLVVFRVDSLQGADLVDPQDAVKIEFKSR